MTYAGGRTLLNYKIYMHTAKGVCVCLCAVRVKWMLELSVFELFFLFKIIVAAKMIYQIYMLKYKNACTLNRGSFFMAFTVAGKTFYRKLICIYNMLEFLVFKLVMNIKTFFFCHSLTPAG